MITCQACGTQNPPDAVYCTNCARKLDPETQTSIAAQRAAHSATGVRWASVAVTAVVVLVIAVLVVLLITGVL